MAWRIVIRAPEDRVLIFTLPGDLDPVPDDAMDRARAEAGVPDGWLDLPGWDVSLSQGDPHPALRGRAELVDWSEGVPG